MRTGEGRLRAPFFVAMGTAEAMAACGQNRSFQIELATVAYIINIISIMIRPSQYQSYWR